MTWVQVNRLFALGLLAAVTVVAPAVLGKAASATGVTAAWTLVGLAAVGVTFAVLVRCAVTGRRATFAAWALLAVVILGLLTYPLVPEAAPGGTPWVAHLVPAAGGAVAMALPVRWVPVGAVALIGAELFAQLSTGWGAATVTVALDAVMTVAVIAALTLPAEGIRIWARRVHDAREAALAASAREAAVLAAEGEAGRWDGLVHDDLLAALNEGARDPGDPAASAAARVALARLISEPATGPVAAQDLAGRIAEQVRVAIPGAVFTSSIDPDTPDVAGVVAGALILAAAEAARNARRHAWPTGSAPGGPSPAVRVEVRTSRGQLSVIVADNGVGFDPGKVAGDRWGLRSAIRARVVAAGGQAVWTSHPGAGTTVTLTFDGPAAAAPADVSGVAGGPGVVR